MKMRRRAVATAALLLLGLGLWQLGGGTWIHVKAALAQVLLRQAWADTRSGEIEAKPWPWADTHPVARLEVPGHRVDLLVLAGASGRTLAFGPGHFHGTAAPGSDGTSVMAGHRDTHFRFLENVAPGDTMTVTDAAGAVRHYTVTGSEIADARTARIRLDRGGSRLVLVTCYPFDAVTAGGPLRYVVTAEAK